MALVTTILSHFTKKKILTIFLSPAPSDPKKSKWNSKVVDYQLDLFQAATFRKNVNVDLS